MPITSPSVLLSTTTTITDNAIHNVDKTSNIQHIFSTSTIINSADKNVNYASMTASDNTPNREQEIVFNSIEGVP